jgi:hypothetical protein
MAAEERRDGACHGMNRTVEHRHGSPGAHMLWRGLSEWGTIGARFAWCARSALSRQSRRSHGLVLQSMGSNVRPSTPSLVRNAPQGLEGAARRARYP